MKNEYRDKILRDIRQRILDEHRKYAHQEHMDWALLAASKIYSSHFTGIITKSDLEFQLGFEINDNFECEPVYVDGKCKGLSIKVEPKRGIVYIDHKFTIRKSGDIEFEI